MSCSSCQTSKSRYYGASRGAHANREEPIPPLVYTMPVSELGLAYSDSLMVGVYPLSKQSKEERAKRLQEAWDMITK